MVATTCVASSVAYDSGSGSPDPRVVVTEVLVSGTVVTTPLVVGDAVGPVVGEVVELVGLAVSMADDAVSPCRRVAVSPTTVVYASPWVVGVSARMVGTSTGDEHAARRTVERTTDVNRIEGSCQRTNGQPGSGPTAAGRFVWLH